ncbi:TM2 domain-containing protein [Aldersonia kunmingensis]|uniref:TM2 domain-containing protein n=1 Tax=Aldersonia kunmingensis TaxID=408066 RepID=UPI00083401BB|nr:TM2 domain-containing protein [Aldersonia kunmingensis]
MSESSGNDSGSSSSDSGSSDSGSSGSSSSSSDPTSSSSDLGPEFGSSWNAPGPDSSNYGAPGPTYGAPGTGPDWTGQGYQQPSYEQPSYEPPTYQQPGYEQPNYQSPQYDSGYPQANYGQPGYPQPGYGAYPANPAYPYATPDAPYGRHPITGEPFSDKQKVTAGVLQIFLGAFGAGRFYLNQPGLAWAQIAVTWLTCGLGGIWPLIDGILMLTGNVRDKFGRPLRD